MTMFPNSFLLPKNIFVPDEEKPDGHPSDVDWNVGHSLSAGGPGEPPRLSPAGSPLDALF